MRKAVIAALVVGAAALGGGAAILGAADWRELPASELPQGVVVRHSPDHRCNTALVSSAGSKKLAAKLAPAVAANLTELGFNVQGNGAFSRGEMSGRYVIVREEDSGGSPWHLRACFYRKRDEHVCQSSCDPLP